MCLVDTPCWALCHTASISRNSIWNPSEIILRKSNVIHIPSVCFPCIKTYREWPLNLNLALGEGAARRTVDCQLINQILGSKFLTKIIRMASIANTPPLFSPSIRSVLRINEST